MTIADPFVCAESVEISQETERLLEQRMETASEDRLLSAHAARLRIREWLSESAITKTR